MWVTLALALALILTLLFFLAVGVVMLFFHSESLTSLARSYERAFMKLSESAEKQVRDIASMSEANVSKLVDGPKLPELPPMGDYKAADEEWLESSESLIVQGDDLSPIYDADEI